MKNYRVIIGFAMICFLALIAILASHLSSHSPYTISLPQELATPSAEHLLGCDQNGTDILAIILHGTRISLLVGFSVTFLCLFIGLILGSVSGWKGGMIDSFIMRILDIIFAFPGIILAIALASVLGPSMHNLIFALAFTGWAGYTRLVRGEVRALKEK